MKALLKRAMAFGDVLMTTPVARRLHAEGYEVFVQSNYAHVFDGNPDVVGVHADGNQYDRVIDLDMAHERRRKYHAAVAYMEQAFGDKGDGHDLSVFMDYGDPPDIGVDWHHTIAIHPNVSWRNRMQPPSWWQRVVDVLRGQAYTVVALGTDLDFSIQGVLDTRGRFQAREQAAVIAAAAAFGCGPSGLFILAGATPARVVTFLTINRAETCLPYRHGELGWGYTAIPASVPCIGCSERSPPVTFLGCERNDYACMATLNPVTFGNALLEAALVRAEAEGW